MSKRILGIGVIVLAVAGLAVVLNLAGRPEEPGVLAGLQADLAYAAAAARPTIDSGVAMQSAQSNLDALMVPRLRFEAGPSGSGQVLAVIDSGVDPRVFAGQSFRAPARVVDWIDLTGEGDVQPLGQYNAEGGVIQLGETALKVGTLRTRSGRFRVGLLPDQLARAEGGFRQIYFVVSDPDTAGLYNTVTIDSDSDLDFSDEVPLREFRVDRSYAVVPISEERSVGVVVSRLDTSTGAVIFGFDLNGHGSGLAALATGDGVFPGVAPGARVVVVKSLASDGLGDWKRIEQGVDEALSLKARVILVGSARLQLGDEDEWKELQSRVASSGGHLVLPAGNAGPGAGTITVTHSFDSTLLVSGYLPQASANALLASKMTGDTWYPLSSCGPDPKGNRGPSFAAPAVAAVPSFNRAGEPVYTVMEGTSVSAAYTAGCVALIRETQSDPSGTLLKPGAFITAGLIQAARKMPDVLPVEQGSGRLDVSAAWDILRSRPDHRRMLIVGNWDGISSSDGICVKGTTPGAFPVWIDNYAPVARVANVSSMVPWLRMRSDLLLMEPVSQRGTVAYGTGLLDPGFYSGEIIADDKTTVGEDSSFVVTVSVPQQFNTAGRADFQLVNGVSTVARQFIKVPEVAESLALTLTASKPGLRYLLYNPEGILVRQGALDGSVTTRIGLPQSGLWQICVFAPDGVALSAPVSVEATLDGFFGLDLGATLDSQYYLVRSPGAKANLRLAATSAAQEWRHRRTYTQPTGRTTQLTLPDVDQSVDVLSVRFGTATGSVLRAYLMHYSQSTGRWSEVGRALTTTSGIGEIHLPNPAPGKYTVFVEAYGAAATAYVEIDVNLLTKAGSGPMPKGIPASVSEGSSTLAIPLPSADSDPCMLIVLRQSDSKVMGVLERPSIKRSDIPVVQVSSGSDIKTLRAWRRSDMKPLDILVTVGGASYQLSKGRVTAPIPDGLHPSLVTAEGTRVLLVPPGEH